VTQEVAQEVVQEVVQEVAQEVIQVVVLCCHSSELMVGVVRLEVVVVQVVVVVIPLTIHFLERIIKINSIIRYDR
jgi:hypothetical protein